MALISLHDIHPGVWFAQRMAGVAEYADSIRKWMVRHPGKTSGIITLPGDLCMFASGILTRDAAKIVAGMCGAFSSITQIRYADPESPDAGKPWFIDPQDRKITYADVAEGRVPQETWSALSAAQFGMLLYSGMQRGEHLGWMDALTGAGNTGAYLWILFRREKDSQSSMVAPTAVLITASVPSLVAGLTASPRDWLMVACMGIYVVGNALMLRARKRVLAGEAEPAVTPPQTVPSARP
ncbi:MAG: hypothetical protein M3O22_01815 [Pseudomonadota bacterium]|nr:hypothetical protein [Pseudomonadota bacterium]